MKDITERLYDKQDLKYRDFTAKLIPGISEERIIGVRLPEIRKIAKEMIKEGEYEDFLDELPHYYQEENQLHSFIISYMNISFEEGIRMMEKFLPYIDNWAVCDSFKPEFLKKEHEKGKPYIKKWLNSGETYTVRSALVILLNWYLDCEDDLEFLDLVAEIKSEEYYVNMAAAWYFSMALVRHYERTLPFIEKRRLSSEIHRKTIQKFIESTQADNDRKEYLRTFK